MSGDGALQLLKHMLWTGFVISAPLLLATLVTGVLVGIFQVVTQLQEMSLSYVPKLIVAFIVLVTLGPWMLGRLTSFATELFLSIPNLK